MHSITACIAAKHYVYRRWIPVDDYRLHMPIVRAHLNDFSTIYCHCSLSLVLVRTIGCGLYIQYHCYHTSCFHIRPLNVTAKDW